MLAGAGRGLRPPVTAQPLPPAAALRSRPRPLHLHILPLLQNAMPTGRAKTSRGAPRADTGECQPQSPRGRLSLGTREAQKEVFTLFLVQFTSAGGQPTPGHPRLDQPGQQCGSSQVQGHRQRCWTGASVPLLCRPTFLVIPKYQTRPGAVLSWGECGSLPWGHRDRSPGASCLFLP